MRPTVLVVDDHAAFWSSARALLQAEGFDIVGEATDGAEAAEAVAEQLATAPNAPAVVLISSRDAAAYGPRLQATPALRSASPPSGSGSAGTTRATGSPI